MLAPGEPAPWFTARSTVNPTFQFETAAGRYIVLCFFGSAGDPESQQLLAEIESRAHGFDVDNYVFFGVSTDPEDERSGRIGQRWPGIMTFWDFDRAVSRLYGADNQRQTLVLDQALRVLAACPFDGPGEAHIKTVFKYLSTLPPMNTVDSPAPVLVVPNVFEPSFCRSLIDLYERHGGQESGYMREIDGKTVPVLNANYKRRSDYVIVEPDVIRDAETRLRRCLIPEIKKAFQFTAAHIERYLIGCYDAATGGFFKRHRDHTTKGTAHRRFAVTINLNAEEYEGGDLRFPEYGMRLYRAPTGGAVAFSCMLSHEVQRVTRGKRYAFLPFLFDDEAAKIREANLPFLDMSAVRVQA